MAVTEDVDVIRRPGSHGDRETNKDVLATETKDTFVSLFITCGR